MTGGSRVRRLCRRVGVDGVDAVDDAVEEAPSAAATDFQKSDAEGEYGENEEDEEKEACAGKSDQILHPIHIYPASREDLDVTSDRTLDRTY